MLHALLVRLRSATSQAGLRRDETPEAFTESDGGGVFSGPATLRRGGLRDWESDMPVLSLQVLA